jgi:outer membrane receptor protein involved in Fe transport
MNVTDSAEWNIAYYSYEPSGYYDEQRLRGNDLQIPAYQRLDMGFTVRFAKRYEVALWGQNLSNERHIEVKEGFITPTTEVQRSFYGKLTTRF